LGEEKEREKNQEVATGKESAEIEVPENQEIRALSQGKILAH
jgi:hypothetical protein